MAYQLPAYVSNSTYGYKPPSQPTYNTKSTRSPDNPNIFQKAFRILNPWDSHTLASSYAHPGGILKVSGTQNTASNPGSSPTPAGSLPGLTFGTTGGGRSSSVGVSNEEAARQRQAIADARKRLQGRADRYLSYFDAQAFELDRQKSAQELAIEEARAKAGEEAGKTRTSLGTQNEQGQADINKRAQASGIFDSSARVGAVGTQQRAFEEAVGQLGKDEQEYYTGLDRQLTDLKAQYNLARQNIDISKSDTQDDIAEKMFAFDQAERDLDAQIAQLRSSAVSAAQQRSSSGAQFFQNLSSISDSLYNMPVQFQTQAIQGLADQYGIPHEQAGQYFAVANAIRILQSGGGNRDEAANILRQFGIDPSTYGA